MSINQNFPNVWPSLVLDFENSKTLDPRITFTRSSTGTYVGSNGLIKTAAADEPRFDHDPTTGESLGLLIEEQRTNYYTTSETMTSGRVIQSSQWTWTSFTEGGPQGGGYIRWERIGTAGNPNPEWNYEIYYNNTGLSIGDKFVVTFYVRCPNGTLDSIKISNPDQEAEIFNIDSQWRKFTKVFTYGVQSGFTFFRFNRGHTPSYVIGTTYDIACLQIEKYEFPTSYIPTSGSTVTRQPDNASITGTNFTDFYNQNEGSFIATFKFESLGVFSYNDAIGLSPLGAALMADNGPSGLVTDLWGGGTRSSGGPDPSSQFVKVARAVNFSNNDSVILSSGGNAVAQSSITQTLATGIQFGKRGSGTIYNNRILRIKQIAYYPERLTDTQLQNLTK